MESRQYFGEEPNVINVSLTKQVGWLFQNNDSWAIAFSQFWGQIDNHFPADQFLQFAQIHSFIFPKVMMKDPIKDAMLVFTDGSSNGRAADVINGKGYIVQTTPASTQIIELRAMTMVFQILKDSSFNLYTDSHYIHRALQVIETVPCI